MVLHAIAAAGPIPMTHDEAATLGWQQMSVDGDAINWRDPYDGRFVTTRPYTANITIDDTSGAASSGGGIMGGPGNVFGPGSTGSGSTGGSGGPVTSPPPPQNNDPHIFVPEGPGDYTPDSGDDQGDDTGTPGLHH